MAQETKRFEWVVTLSRIGLIVLLVILALTLAATIARLVDLCLDRSDWLIIAKYSLLVAVHLLAIVCAFALYGLVKVVVSNEESVKLADSRMERIETLLEDQTESTRQMIDLASLSDQAKSLIYREREAEAFRDRVHEALVRQDYQTAEGLIESIEKKLGYADEAGRLREELENFRKATIEEKVDAAIARVQAIIDTHDWNRAARQAHRLMEMMPDNPKVDALPQRIQNAKTKHKRELLKTYNEAVKKNDVDRGIELLRELDRYLTPQEAAALEESARGVFKARLHNLGVQFALKVTDEQWSDAITVGNEIVREFPNSRMAQEVRGKMDILRQKAFRSSP